LLSEINYLTKLTISLIFSICAHIIPLTSLKVLFSIIAILLLTCTIFGENLSIFVFLAFYLIISLIIVIVCSLINLITGISEVYKKEDKRSMKGITQ